MGHNYGTDLRECKKYVCRLKKKKSKIGRLPNSFPPNERLMGLGRKRFRAI